MPRKAAMKDKFEKFPFVCDSYDFVIRDWNKIVWATLRLPDDKFINLKKEAKP